MRVCTFFGHRECSADIKSQLYDVLKKLILQNEVTMFYVGNQGQFDAYVRSVLRRLQTEYPFIRYAVVLAYMPGKKIDGSDDTDTMLPEGIETIHPRYALAWRNQWMLGQSQYVVSYVTHTWGGAAKYAGIAARQGKVVINLAECAN